MESTQSIKKRLKSVANIGKITKAMELVAATKMRKSQEIALVSRPYAFAALDLLADVSSLKTELPPILKKRPVKTTLLVLVASDKGLAGAFNSAIFRKFEKYILRDKALGSFVAVGEKAFHYLSRKKHTVVKKFTNAGDFTTAEQVRPLADFLVEGYLGEEFDRVLIFSSHFRSAFKQEPLVREILPVGFKSIKQTLLEIAPITGRFAVPANDLQNIESASVNSDGSGKLQDYLVEPSPDVVLDVLVRHLLFMQVYHLILEANAAEHSARRLAMKTASDNAADLAEKLNLQYNKSRQAVITSQIIEISAGVEALS